jgi:hypothetical protein
MQTADVWQILNVKIDTNRIFQSLCDTNFDMSIDEHTEKLNFKWTNINKIWYC